MKGGEKGKVKGKSVDRRRGMKMLPGYVCGRIKR